MKTIKLLFLLSLTILSTDLAAQSGTLDPTFDGDGIVTTNVSTTPSIDAGNAAVVQPDGKIIVAGVSNSKFTVIRYNTDWSLDLTFNTYGVAFPYTVTSLANSAILQPDGKIIIAGIINSNSVLVRLNANGTLDTSFSTDGKTSLYYNSVPTYIRSLALTTGGKIMAAGYNGSNASRNFILYRFNDDGSLDTTFDTDGIVTTDIGTAADLSSAMIIQPDDRIIVAGQATIAGNYDFALVRYNTDGSLDTSFGGSGKVTTAIGTENDIIKAVDLQTDGKIVVSGYTINATINYIASARYNTDGTLDTSFDSDGKATFVAGTSTEIKVLFDGKIVVSSTANSDYSVAKLNIDGSLDTSFGTNGYATHNIGTDTSNFMCIKTDGTILVGGTSDNRISTVQFSTTGSLVSFFQSPEISLGYNAIAKVVIQPDGKTVVAGITEDRIALARYNNDGSFDSGFGTNGILITSQIPFDGTTADIELFVMQDGKIVVVSSEGSMRRYLPDGTTDTTFGINGIADLTATVTYLDNAILATDGKFYLAIDYEFNSESQLALLRINSDGSIDTTFGTNGIAYTRFTFYASDDINYARELVELPNGKILIAGYIIKATTNDYAVGITQFNSDGTLDTTFGTNGKIITQIGIRNVIQKIVRESDGKFIISIKIDNISHSIKYNSDGTIDTAYGTNGIVIDAFNSPNLLLQPDGKLLKSGFYNNHFATTRYNIDGSTDTTFGTTGILSTTIGVGSNINSMALDQDGKLVVAGYSFNGYNDVFAIARYGDLALGNIDFTSNKSMFIYPNPIEEETNLTYKLTTATYVSIELFDMQGKLLKTYLKNANQNPDEYNQKIVFPSGLQSGNYLLRISSPDGSNTIKLMKK